MLLRSEYFTQSEFDQIMLLLAVVEMVMESAEKRGVFTQNHWDRLQDFKETFADPSQMPDDEDEEDYN